MEFTRLISGRESIRSFDPTKPVDKAVLERILEAGRMAPSAANRQPWRFLVISSREMLNQVRRSYPKPWFVDAPQILAVAGRTGEAWTRQDGWNSIETDLAIAMDHIILAAENEGVATCWVASFDPTILRSALSLTSEDRVYAVTPIGYPRPGFAKKAKRERKGLTDVVRYL
ncbi:MAG TPA: nitroreductase family protein [Spirochaetia bacterium]|nr:nitroreductase family protein [Spirochaetia bacterium]